MNTETETETAPVRVAFQRLTPPKIYPLDSIERPGGVGEASRTLAFLREQCTDGVWAPVPLDDLDDPITVIMTDLWAAGLIDLRMAIHPHTGQRLGICRPIQEAPCEANS